MEYLTLDDILAIRDQIARDQRNVFSVRRPGSLMAAIEAPRRVLFGEEIFSSLSAKAGALSHGLIEFHPFWDGNKRIATRALHLFLQRNGARLTLGDEALRVYARDIARGTLTRDDVVAWLEQFIEDSA